MELLALLGVYAAVFFTLAIYTILYKENPWYRFAESVFLGLAVGYQVALDMKYVRDQWAGQWSSSSIMMIGYVLAILIGLLWYFRFTKQYFYLYRWPLAIIVGTGIGAALRTVIFAQFTTQIIAQAKLNLWVPTNLMTMFNNIMIFIMVPCVVLYFWFTGSYRESGPMKIIDKVARYTMMAGFGAGFGYTILTRYAMFIGRAQYLLGITPNPAEARPAFIVIALIMLATMIGYDLMNKNKTKTV
ncbi:MAG: hypothetical protein NTV61_02005 [Candidatus Bathyarchaeota archaeon]|nr:hypothetical protein [Candidatus Bathyarchaeota archaeon]